MNENNSSNPLMMTIKSYDKIAEDYCGTTLEGGDREFQEKMIDITLKYLPKKPRVIDLGCGDGRDTNYLHQKGADVVGIDLSQGMINLARQNHPKIAFFKQDMRETVFPDDTFHC
ncbi:MAG: class I SAM-dependent DNA methyltransferase, partial [Thermoplasmatota archaeon]